MTFTQERKDLMHLVMNEKFELLPIFHQLAHYRDCDRFLRWLLQNNITGSNLVDWIKTIHKNSVMSMVKFIVKFNEKNREEKAIVLGRDWIK